ncbi:MAG: hypothetical protein AB1491_11145 [Thermodesulfobacteriota bacterium]
MAEGRGKRGRKAPWQVKLGVRELFFAGLGMLGLLSMSFALGTLAGRGDIYRVLHNWGLLGPEVPRAVQPWLPPGGQPPLMLPASPAGSPGVQAPPAAPNANVAAAPASPATPVAGSVAAVPGAPAAKKKSKDSASYRDRQAKAEELRRLREEVSRKLKFQNSLDTPTPKPSRLAQKQKGKEKPGAKAASPSLVRVALYRDSKAAKAKMAELQKKGEKVTLKQGKDKKGAYYAVYRQSQADQGELKEGTSAKQKANDNKQKSR